MICHSITVFNAPPAVSKKTTRKGKTRQKGMPRLEIGSEDHLRAIFEKTKEENQWLVGDLVQFKGAPYEVLYVEETFEACHWDGYSPLLIGIYGDDQQFLSVHPNRLKALK